MPKPSSSAPHAPQPEQGWSREIVTVRDALVVPDPLLRTTRVTGVVGPEGDCRHATIYRGPTRFFRPVTEPPAPAARLAGRHLWGGFLFAHFGHFLCESTSRLWAADAEGVESIVFAPRNSGIAGLEGYQQRFLALLGVERPVRLLKEPTAVEELVVPGQGFGLGAISRGTPEFRAMAARLAQRIEPKGAERIYISRSRVGGKGRIMHERLLEENLERAGFTIYHPQAHGLEEQLAQYRAATHIVGLDGSAFHLAAFVADASQRFGIILRRNMGAYYNVQRQIEGFSGRAPEILNVLVGDWMPSGKRKPDMTTLGEIDHARLAERLMAEGFIEGTTDWRLPTEKERAASMRNVWHRMGKDAVRRPVETPVELALAGLY